MSAPREVAAEIAERLRRRGVAVDGRERDEELVTLLDAVEAFERAVERGGGDLMVDEPVAGRVEQPDAVAFVLPLRQPREAVADFEARVREATNSLAARRHDGRRGGA